MKTEILTGLLICIVYASFSQDSSMFRMNDSLAIQKNNYVTRKAGKVIVVENGINTSLHADLLLKNGTKVKTDGTVIMKNGKRAMVREGQKIYLNTNTQMSKPEKAMQDSSYRLKDSSR